MHAGMRLGRAYPSQLELLKAPKLTKYQRKALPKAPDSCDNTQGAHYAMYANDRLGDCTIAAIANHIATTCAREGSCIGFSDQDVIDYYLHLGNGRDWGLVETDVLAYWQAKGFPLSGGHKLAAWVRVDPHDLETVKSLVSIYWALYVGASLPRTAQSQAVWTAPPSLVGDGAPGSWGGHAVVLPKYDASGPTFITWGQQKRAEWGWYLSYVDELYCLLDADRARMWGVDWDALEADLQAAGT